MNAKPVLVLQLRRMGDLILTFPLLMDIQRRFPQSPVWVAARPVFFEQLMPFAPNATFFPPEHLPMLAKHDYEAIINLGGGTEAACCAGHARADIKLGPVCAGSALHVHGFWQLYRASLTSNNRHNVFHWADLFRMDFTPLPLPALTRPRPQKRNSGRIGLFVGASEPAKRPDAPFWASLASRLAAMGFKPILLGGPTEKELGTAIMAKNARAANFCGQTSIAQLAGLVRALDLLITPDTGPMHLADWLGTPVFNLSMGPVQALETGPLSPGHHILRPIMSCVGCWRCHRGRYYCRNAFMASAVAKTAAAVARAEIAPIPPGHELLRTSRDNLRLFSLAHRREGARLLLDNFWGSAFLHFGGACGIERLAASANSLLTSQPKLADSMRRSAGKIITQLAQSSKKGDVLPKNFWKSQPLHTRLFAGHTQMALQNEDYSRPSLAGAIERAKLLEDVLAGWQG